MTKGKALPEPSRAGAETERTRDDALRRALATPPKKHKTGKPWQPDRALSPRTGERKKTEGQQ
jgi:hypothetical protein